MTLESDLKALSEKSTSQLIIRHTILSQAQWQTVLDTIKTHGAITELTLESMELNDNQIVELAVALSEQKELVSLRLNVNAFTHIGLSYLQSMLTQSKKLQYLDLSNNVLGKAGAVVLADTLKDHTGLIELSFQECHLHWAGLQALSLVLRQNLQLEIINLNGNFLGIAACELLAELLSRHQQLRQFDVIRNEIGTEGLLKLIPIFKTNAPTLIDILLDGNYVGPSGLQALAPILNTHHNWKRIAMGDSRLGGEGAKELAKLLIGNTNLTDLYVQHNHFGYNASRALFTIVAQNPNLQWLDFSNNELGDAGIVELAAILKDRQNIRHLKLSGNRMSQQGLASLVAVLEQNQQLETLELARNPLGQESAITLSSALKSFTSLRSLNLADCLLEDTTLETIANAIGKHAQLRELNLDANMLQEPGIKVLANRLSNHSQLTGLWLSGNRMNAEAYAALFPLLDSNLYLRNLGLENNCGPKGITAILPALKRMRHLRGIAFPLYIGPEGMASLVPVIENNIALVHINIGAGKIGEKGAYYLAQALHHHRQLVYFSLSHCQLGPYGVAHLVPILLNNPNIYHLLLQDHMFGPLGMQSLVPAIERLDLQYLDVGANRIGSVGAKFLAYALRNHRNLRHLSLWESRLNRKGDGLAAILPVLSQNHQMITLALSDNNLIAADIQRLADALNQHTLFLYLGVSSNPLGPDSLAPLKPILKQNPWMEHLGLSDTGIGMVDMQLFIEMIPHFPFLNTLRLRGLAEGNEWIAPLGAALNQTTLLSLVDFALCKISFQNFTHVISLFSHNPDLTNFDLGVNDIGDDNMAALAAGLSQHRRLTSVSLHDTKLGEAGLMPLKSVLSHNRNLVSLNFDNNRFGDNATALVVNLVNGIPGLIWFFVGNNNFQEEGYIEVIKALRRHHQLRGLWLTLENIRSQGVSDALAEYASGDVNLQHLFVANSGDNSLTGREIVALLPIFDSPAIGQVLLINAQLNATHLSKILQAWRNDGVHAIDLHDNPLGNDGVRILLQWLANVTHVQWISLEGTALTDEVLPDLVGSMQQNTQADFALNNNQFSTSVLPLIPLIDNFVYQESNFLPIDYVNNLSDFFTTERPQNQPIVDTCDLTQLVTTATPTLLQTTVNIFSRQEAIANTTTPIFDLTPPETMIMTTGNIILIAGLGTLGGIALTLAMLGLVWCYRRHRNNSSDEMSQDAVAMKQLEQSDDTRFVSARYSNRAEPVGQAAYGDQGFFQSANAAGNSRYQSVPNQKTPGYNDPHLRPPGQHYFNDNFNLEEENQAAEQYLAMKANS